jgi:hypothetical protein
MKRWVVKLLATVGLTAVAIAGSAARADAAFVVKLCDDAACSAGGDITLTDGDLDGIIAGAGTFGNFEFVLTAAQSKPFLSDGMDLNFVVSNANGTTGGTVYIYAADTNFVGPETLTGAIGGTLDTGTSLTAYLCGGTDNSGPTPINSGCVSTSFGPAAGLTPYAGIVGPLNATANPYSVALGVAVTIPDGLNATVSGDFRTTPEPASLGLFGLALFGLGGAIRRRFSA